MKARNNGGARAALIISLLAALAAGAAAPAHAEPEAATIVVTTTADELNADGDCSLREAVQAANQDVAASGCAAGSGINDVIVVPPGVYALDLAGAGGLRLTESTFIRGSGAGVTFIDGNNVNTVFAVDYSELFVCDASDAQVLRYTAKGTYAGVFIAAGAGGLSLPNDIQRGAFSANEGYVYVSGFLSGVKRYNRATGAYVDTLSTAGSSGTFAPTSLAFGDPGNFDFSLYATNYQPSGGGNAPGVWRFNPDAATYLNVFVPTSFVPNSIVFGTGDDLFVSDPTNNRIRRYDGGSGAFIENFVGDGFTGGLNQPRGLVFRGNHLYVASELSNQILRYNAANGAFVDAFVAAGAGGLSAPTQLTFGPDGHLYVLSSGTQSILRYDGLTGAFSDVFVADGEGPLGQASCLRWLDGVGTGPVVNISDVTIQNGLTGVYVDHAATALLVRDVVIGNDNGFGGGVANNGFAQILDSIVISNTSFNFGGGVYNAGSVTIAGSTIAGNYAPNAGGGIFNAQGNLTAYNSTISGNRTDRAGGGIMNQENAYLNNVTIVNNAADSEASAGDYGGGGIFNNPGASVLMRNSIVAGNTDYPAVASEAPDCMGAITSYRRNLIGNAKNCALDDPGSPGTPFDQVGVPGAPIDAKLGPLAFNGGRTLTHRLLEGSPAIDQGSIAQDNGDPTYACREHDQRGYSRALGGRCDVGAFEIVTFRVALPIAVK